MSTEKLNFPPLESASTKKTHVYTLVCVSRVVYQLKHTHANPAQVCTRGKIHYKSSNPYQIRTRNRSSPVNPKALKKPKP
jgi:hypothetical protein